MLVRGNYYFQRFLRLEKSDRTVVTYSNYNYISHYEEKCSSLTTVSWLSINKTVIAELCSPVNR
jgi:hypothetical protein